MTKALCATAIFSVAAVLLAVVQGDSSGGVIVRLFIVLPLLLLVASVVTIVISSIAALAAFGRRSSPIAALVAGLFGWLAASGGYQSFGGLGSYSDLVQPAFAAALALPWLISTSWSRQPASTEG